MVIGMRFEGGMKAVIWTDVFQAIIMLVGILSVIVLGVGRLEGFGSVFDISSKGQRLNLLKCVIINYD